MRTADAYGTPELAYEDEIAADHESWLNRSALWLLFSIHGRIPRLAYWLVSLVVVFVYVIAMVVAAKFVKDTEALQLVSALIYLPLLWVSVALQVKRWHDRDKSGWWFFICFVPLIGYLWSFIELGFFRGTYGPNRFGDET